MTNHPNRRTYRSHRYFRVCPRGFANEVIYLRVPLLQVPEVEAHFADYTDRQFIAGQTNASCGWTADKRATMPGVAVDWADRAYVGL